MKRIGVTGASGFIGSALVEGLRKRGDFVRAFTRNPNGAQFPPGVEVRRLDLTRSANAAEHAAALEGLDVVVHLAGENVAGRWTPEKKRKIHDSRTITTTNLVAAIRACSQPPRALISASASGYYGSRGDEPLDESSPPGNDFLAGVCIDWEREAKKAAEFGIRVVCVRQGLVLGLGGGALQAMLTPFRLGVGGPLGSGRQWWAWIHLEDDVALLLFAIDRDDLNGPVNAVSPDLATNARFSQALGHALRRPSLAFAPALALKVVLGEFSQSVLASQLILPARAEDLGFAWKHESLDHALLDLLDSDSHRAPAILHYEMSQTVAAERGEVFQFFSNAANLALLTPPSLEFRIVAPQPTKMQRGAVIESKLRVRGLPVNWKTLVVRWQPQMRFTDMQLRGPYLLWRHQHDFESGSDGVVVRDRIDYALPLAPLSNIALPLVRGDLRRIFEYRRSQLVRLLGLKPP